MIGKSSPPRQGDHVATLLGIRTATRRRGDRFVNCLQLTATVGTDRVRHKLTASQLRKQATVEDLLTTAIGLMVRFGKRSKAEWEAYVRDALNRGD